MKENSEFSECRPQLGFPNPPVHLEFRMVKSGESGRPKVTNILKGWVSEILEIKQGISNDP